MNNDYPLTCGTCQKTKPKREVKRIGDRLVCNKCHSEEVKNHREYLLRDVLGVRKRSDLLIEWKKNREEREIQTLKMKGSKEEKPGKYLIKGKSYSFGYLTQLEKQFLFRKYSQLGFDSEEIKRKIESDVEFIKNLVKNLKLKNKSDEQINLTFKEEFAKLLGKC